MASSSDSSDVHRDTESNASINQTDAPGPANGSGNEFLEESKGREYQDHDFLLEREYRQGNKYDSDPERRLKVMADLRDGLEMLPKTKTTFTIDDLLKRCDGDSAPRQVEKAPMLALLGSWRLPNRYKGRSQRDPRYINPRSFQASAYTDIAVECDCGAMISQVREQPDVDLYEWESSHRDDCKTYWRKEASAKLLRAREAWVVRGTFYMLNQNEIMPRMAHVSDMTSITEYVDWSFRELRERGREAGARTMKRLNDQGAHMETIGRAYGMSQQSVSRHISKYVADDSN